MKNPGLCVGKKVLLLSEAEVLGVVSNFLLDFRTGKISRLTVGDGELVFPLKNVAAENDVVVLGNMSGVQHRFELDSTRYIPVLGADAYSTDGNLLGTVTGVECADTMRAEAFLCGEVRIDAPLLSAKEGCFVFRGENGLSVRKAREKKLPRPKEDYGVEMLDGEAACGRVLYSAALAAVDEAPSADRPEEAFAVDEATVVADDATVGDMLQLDAPRADNRIETVSTAGITIAEALDGARPEAFPPDAGVPSKIIRDYGFLLGRRALVSVRAQNGEVLAALGAVITVAVVDKVKRNGKLLELILNSK